MQVFHNDQSIKDKYVRCMKDHIAADELVRGVGFENGKGCAVGCTLNNYQHSAFESDLGIPVWAAYLLDKLHENTSEDYLYKDKKLALAFLEAVPVGADISSVKNKINIFILERNKSRVEALNHITPELKAKVIAAIDQCIELHTNYLNGVIDLTSAERSAESAAWSAASAEYDAIANKFIELLEAA